MSALVHEQTVHEFNMAAGSKMLLSAIKAARNGHDPVTPDELVWTHNSGGDSQQLRYIGQRRDEVFTARNPCGRCGVRQDHHANHGCGTYARSVFG